MPENDQLLRAVLDNPDDDGPRLKYAEWCEQQSDPATKDRGRFIRTQIARIRLTDPTQENELNYVSNKLEDLHGPAWASPLASLAQSDSFDRGFVELVSMPAKLFLEKAPQLFRLAPVRHLALTGVLPVAHELFGSEHLRSIRSLEMNRCNLGDEEISLLANSPHLQELRWLSLAYNRIGDDGVGEMARSPYLAKLAYANFAGNPIEPNEQYSYDNGYVVDSGLSADGLRLEERLGHLRWLHHQATTIMDSMPDRFRIAA
jgi:uncharacterized protein (TIGR02996 family)